MRIRLGFAFVMALIYASVVHAHTEEGYVTRIDTIDEVVITGTQVATDVRHLSQTVNVIGRNSIEESNRMSLLPLLTEQVPGLFITQRGQIGYGVSEGSAGNMSMRGLSSSSSRMLVMIDGHPNYAGIYGHAIADSYQSLMTERVEVLRGPASLLYGSNAMGGVVNIVTRKPHKEGVSMRYHGGAGLYGTIETELALSAATDKWSVTVGGAWDRTDGHREGMDFSQLTGYSKVDYKIGTHLNSSATIDMTHFHASQPGPTFNPLMDANQRVTRGSASLSLDNTFDKTEGSLSLFYSWGNHWINDGYSAGQEPKAFRFESTDGIMGLSLWQSAMLFAGNRLTAGVDVYHSGGKADNRFVSGPQEGSVVSQVDAYEKELAGYVEMRQMLGTLLTINGGLRRTYHTKCGAEWIPQLGVALHLPADIEVKISASKGFRYPIVRELYMYAPRNPNLKAESLWNYEVALSQSLFSNRVNYGVNLFYIDAQNLILTLPNPDGGGMLNQNSGVVENKGVELQASSVLSPYVTMHGNYSYLYMKNPVIGAPEHKAYIGVSFSKNRLHTSTGMQYIKGLYSSIEPVNREEFLLWNAKCSYQLSSLVQLWLNVDNILDTKYQINNGYPMPGISFMTGVNLSF